MILLCACLCSDSLCGSGALVAVQVKKHERRGHVCACVHTRRELLCVCICVEGERGWNQSFGHGQSCCVFLMWCGIKLIVGTYREKRRRRTEEGG